MFIFASTAEGTPYTDRRTFNSSFTVASYSISYLLTQQRGPELGFYEHGTGSGNLAPQNFVAPSFPALVLLLSAQRPELRSALPACSPPGGSGFLLVFRPAGPRGKQWSGNR